MLEDVGQRWTTQNVLKRLGCHTLRLTAGGNPLPSLINGQSLPRLPAACLISPYFEAIVLNDLTPLPRIFLTQGRRLPVLWVP